MIRIQRRLACLRDDRGVTLVELIIYMALSSLVLALAGTFFVGVAKATTQAVDRRSSTAEAQNMLDVLSADIRAGTNVPVTSTNTTWAVLSASPTLLTIITYTDAGPTFGQPYQVSFTVDGSGRMVLSQWNPPVGGTQAFPVTGTPSVTRYVGSGVQSSALPLFSYQDSSGNPVTSTCTSGTGNCASIAAVVLTVTVKAPKSSIPVTVTNTVYMPNAGLATAYAGAN